MKWILFFLVMIHKSTVAQDSEAILRTIAFYNLENLFDTIDDPETFDEDYTPSGALRYSSHDYSKKLYQLASVICGLGRQSDQRGPHILGVSEVENKEVLKDLIAQPCLDSLSYAFLHEDSPDLRGIDVALIYREDLFFPMSYNSHEVRIWNDHGNRIYTRDILWVHGILDSEEIHLLVNHWPSRRGGASRSAPKRMKAAIVNQKIVGQIRNQEPNAKILILGDFNDDPKDRSMIVGLGAKTRKRLDSTGFYSPMIPLFKKGYNTLVYRDQIHLFDQILLSSNFLESNANAGFKFSGAGIYNPSVLSIREGKYRGYPNRSFQNGKYNGGFSDHYPVYVELIK